MILVLEIVLVSIPFKLLQVKGNEIINKKLSNGHAIILNSDINKESTQCKITKGHYSYVFISCEIALSKKFKENILNHHFFNDRLCLLAVD